MEGLDKERHLQMGEIIIIVTVLLMWAGAWLAGLGRGPLASLGRRGWLYLLDTFFYHSILGGDELASHPWGLAILKITHAHTKAHPQYKSSI